MQKNESSNPLLDEEKAVELKCGCPAGRGCCQHLRGQRVRRKVTRYCIDPHAKSRINLIAHFSFQNVS